MENKYYAKLDRAQRRVAKIKGFYNHLAVFVVINSGLWLFKDKMMTYFFGEEVLSIPGAMSWVNWNILIWMFILLVHGLLVYGNIPVLLKKWEDRQMEKFIQEEKEEMSNNQ